MLFSSPILAYIDPGSGAIVLQAILAAVFGLGIVFRRIFIMPVKSFFGLFRSRK